jgi:uncharacterized HAD superfamily protein
VNLSFVRYADLARVVGGIPPMPEIRCVVGVPRSGMVPAAMLAIQMGVPLGMAGTGVAGGGARIGGDTKLPDHGILLVDDSILTGQSMREAKAALVDQGVPEHAIQTLAVFAYPGAEDMVDFYSFVLPAPRIFEWNLFNSDLARNVMFDLDGVMCFDPEVFDDDGDEYAAAIRTATPRFLPRRPVHSIVTNRIERWRRETEEWLALHGVAYGDLVMQPFETAAERRERSDPAEYKGARYADSEAWLFVESHDAIAEGICGVAKRPVLSIQSYRIFKGST